MSSYPTDRKNSGYFARFTKALFASNAVSESGKDAFLLVLFVASIEDRTHYNKPAKLWRSQLMEATAISSPKAILAARSKAIELGLLHYCEGSRTSQPIYWTLVPSWLELHMRRVPNRNVKTSTRSKSEHETERETEHETERLQEPSTHIPKEKRPRFEKPSLEDVKAYCKERRNRVNPEQFCDHYEANGWIQGKGKPIRDWKAAVRTWERNGFDNSTAKKSEEYPDLTPRKRTC
jgi:hypothetical protein